MTPKSKQIVVTTFSLLVFGVVVYFLIQILQGNFIAPQSLDLKIISFRYYGLTMALAVVSAYYLAQKRRVLFNISAQLGDRIIFFLVIFGFLGARLYHILSDYQYYSSYISEIFSIWHGGLGIYGALAGGLLVLIFYARKKSSSFSISPSILGSYLNWLTPSILVGQIIGRFGNLFNYELFGYPTLVFWGLFVPERFRPVEYLTNHFFHPLFLYEILINFFILIILIVAEKKISFLRTPGVLFLWYVLFYTIGRFFLEFMRIDTVFIGQFRQNAIVSLLLFVLSLSILIYVHARKKT